MVISSDNSTADQVQRAVTRAIMTGAIRPGEWLREESLAERFGFSRTPIREACNRLARDGLIERVPRRGCRAFALDVRELEDVYPILLSLEILGIQQITEPVDRLADELSALNFNASEAPKDALTLFEVDNAWHRRAVAASHNKILTELHERLSVRIARYVYAYWHEHRDISRSLVEHERITEAMARDDRDLACALLRSHRLQGLESIRRFVTDLTRDDRSDVRA